MPDNLCLFILFRRGLETIIPIPPLVFPILALLYLLFLSTDMDAKVPSAGNIDKAACIAITELSQ